jgi:hypothetical protein
VVTQQTPETGVADAISILSQVRFYVSLPRSDHRFGIRS